MASVGVAGGVVERLFDGRYVGLDVDLLKGESDGFAIEEFVRIAVGDKFR